MFGQGFGQTGAGPPVFGQGTSGQNQPAFGTGQTTTGFGTSGQTPFGGTSQPAFGSTGQAQTGFGGTSQQSPLFGETTSSSAFGGTAGFGATTSSSAFGATAGFGATTSSSAFGGTAGFGATTSSSAFGGTSGFGTATSPSTFGGSSSGFGAVTKSTTFGDGQGTSNFGTASTSSSSGFGQTPAFGVTTCTAPSAFGMANTFGTGTTTNAPAFGSGQTTSGSAFGKTTTSSIFGGSDASTFGGTTKSSSAFGGTNQNVSSGFGASVQGTSTSVFSSSSQSIPAFGGTGQSSSVFGNAGQSSSTFGGTGQGGSPFGGTGQVGSTFGGTGQGSSAFGGTGQGSSAFCGTGQGSSSFGGTGQGSSAFGGTGQGSSTFGATGQGSATFGATGQGSSTFGATGQGSSTLGATGQGSSTFGGTSQGGSTLFGGSTKSSSTFGGTGQGTPPAVFGGTVKGSSVFGGQINSTFGSSTGFGTVTTAQGHPGQQQTNKDTGSTASLVAGTTTTNVFGGASKTSAGSVFGGQAAEKSQTGSAADVPLFGGATGDLSKQLHPPRTTFIIKPTMSSTGEDTKDSVKPGGAALQDQNGTEVSASGSSRQLFGKTSTQTQGLFGKGAASDTRKLGRKTSDDADEAPRAKKTMLRRLSSVSSDMSDKVVIVCRNVPAKYNNARNLRSHFSKFGLVKRTFPNTRRQQAIIHFNTHEEAANAKRLGSRIDPSMNPMEIFWSRHSVTSPGGQKQGEETRSSEHGKRRATDTDRTRPAQLSKWMKSEVDDELSSMAGTSDISSGNTDRALKRPTAQSRPTRNLSPSTRTRQASPVTRTRQDSPATVTPSSTEDMKIGKDSLRVLANSVGHTVAERIQILKLRDKITRHRRTKQSSLATAKAFVGSCPDMCPEMERYDRQEKRRLHAYETIQGVELQPGMNPQVDHLRAVKEYSRSSADQEEPLPYELRPVSVLVMTMNYLLSEIADKGSDGAWGDWFDFLWNRMRGIRKDITQQQLCDVHTAELLEKCVRFHVFCAERLCEEDMFSFDEKINNENMTKCLQTLKELYHDLMKKHNIFCHNEAEIRAYMILMNLNQGDILRETQQLRAEVRNSPLIRFALQVYSALNSHNYVRFFRLVRDASYLNACIMHRYFTQVRGMALKRILFTCGKGQYQYAIDNLVRILGFENSTEAADFCQFYGLRADSSTVILNRSNFIQPENSWLPRRAERLIESKRLVSIGEVINGEALSPLNLPVPSFSFDDNGKFTANIGVSATDMVDSPVSIVKSELDSAPPVSVPPPYPGPSQSRPVAPPPYPGPSQSRPGIKIETGLEFKPHIPVQSVVQPVQPQPLQPQPIQRIQPQPIQPQPVQPQPPKFTGQEVKECAKFLFWEVIDEFCGQMSEETHRDVQIKLDESHAIVNSLVEEFVKDDVSVLSEAYYNEIQIIRQRQLKQEREATLKRAMAALVSEVIKEVTNQELLNFATAKVREIKAELKEQQKARCSIDVGEDLVEDVVDELVQSVASEVHQKDVVERLEELADIEKCVQLRIAGRFLLAWKKEFLARQKLKRGMLTFPSAPGMDSASEQINMLIPDRRDDGIVGNSFSISNDGRLSLASAIQLSNQRWVEAKLLSAHELYQNLCQYKAWQPFDIVKLVGGNVQKIITRTLKGERPASIYWKLLLALPDPDTCETEREKVATGQLNLWLRSKFSKSSKVTGQDEVLSLYKADLTRDNRSSPCKLCVCVRAVQGPQLRSDRRGVEAMMGVSGILLALPPGMEENPESTYWRRARQRLDSLLKLKPCRPAVSLVILCPIATDQSMVTDDLVRHNIMDKYLHLDKVSNVYILDVDYREDLETGFDLDSLSLSTELGEAVQWLGEEYPCTPPMCVNYIRDFVDSTLHKHFYTRVLYNLKQRKVNGCLHQRPSDLLTLYNDIIRHMEEVVTSPRLFDLSWPVPEFSRTNVIEGLPTPYWNDEDHLEYLGGIIHELELPWLQDIDLENTDWSEVCDEIWAFVRSVSGDDHGSAKVDLVSKIRLLLRMARRDFEDTCYLLEGENQCEPSFENVPWTDVVTACIEYRMTSISFTDPQLEHTESEDQELKVVYFDKHLKSYKPPQAWTYLESQRDITSLPSLNHTVQTAVEKTREAKLEQSRRLDRIQDPNVTSTSCADIDLDPLTKEEMATKEDTRRLLESVKTQRRESQKFDQYLQKVLNDFDTDSPDQTFDRENQSFFSPNLTVPPEFMDASGIEPSVFGDCITPKRYKTPDINRISAFKLLDTSVTDLSTFTGVKTGVSNELEKLKDEIALCRRSSAAFEQKLQQLIDDGP